MLAGRNRLPRATSLKSRRDIERLFRDGRRHTCNSLACVWQPSDRFQYGVFVGRALGSAVERNRIKRRLREAIRLCRGGLKEPVRLGILPRQGSAQTGFRQLYAEINQTIEHINDALN